LVVKQNESGRIKPTTSSAFLNVSISRKQVLFSTATSFRFMIPAPGKHIFSALS